MGKIGFLGISQLNSLNRIELDEGRYTLPNREYLITRSTMQGLSLDNNKREGKYEGALAPSKDIIPLPLVKGRG